MKKYKYTKYITINGHRFAIRADTKTELGRKIERKIQQEKEKRFSASDRTLSDWAEECIELYKTGQADITRKKYKARVRSCILAELGDIKISAITPERCQIALNRQAGKSRTQIDEVYQALKFIFSHAVAAGLIGSDPTALLVKPKKGKSRQRRALTEEERRLFLQIAFTDPRFNLFLLSYYCGCRPSEAEKCTGADLIDRDGAHLLHIRGTKTDLADRFVPVPSRFWEAIKDTPKNAYIGATGTGHAIDQTQRKRIWRRLIREMNIAAGAELYRNAIITPVIPEDLSPYCLRHDYCSRLAKSGVDIRTAQKLMGHATINMTANIYTHIDQADLVDAVALLNE